MAKESYEKAAKDAEQGDAYNAEQSASAAVEGQVLSGLLVDLNRARLVVRPVETFIVEAVGTLFVAVRTVLSGHVECDAALERRSEQVL